MTYQEELFQQVKNAFAPCTTIHSGNITQLAAEFFLSGTPDVVFALLCHWTDLHEEGDPFDIEKANWKDMLLETLRRSFFDEQASRKRDTHHLYSNSGALRLVTHDLIRYASSLAREGEEFDLSGLPDNVYVFADAIKTKQ